MNRKILVVDDNADAAAILRNTLEAHGYAVAVADSGAAALAMAADQPQPDAILLDIMMPEMSGLEVLQRLKEAPRTARIPVILVTAKAQDEDLLSGYRTGADYYITKPFSTRQLLYGLDLVLGKADAGA